MAHFAKGACMIGLQIELLAIALLAALSCALPGLFLVLRGMALMSDAMSHAILLGIILMFMLIKTLYSPLLLLGAALAGLATAFCVEALIATRQVKKDTAIGLVFPLFFSLGVILINLYARDVHLDSDMVLLGELALAPFHRLQLYGWDLGPYALWQLGAILALNCFVIWFFYKELALASFDPEFAHVAGFSPIFIHYVLMGLTSITAVGAFDAVGAIVVVALMTTPGATAYLLTHDLRQMVRYTAICSMLSAIGGYGFALWVDVSIAGSIAMMAGVLFALVFVMKQFEMLKIAK